MEEARKGEIQVTGSIDKYEVKGSSKPRWRYRIYTGRDAAGQKQYTSKAGFEKQGDAADAMRLRMNELEHAAGRPAPVAFGEHLQQWLDNHATQRCAPITLQRYRELAAYIPAKSALSVTPLREVTAPQLETALYDLLKAPGKRRKHIGARTVRHVAEVITVALNKAVRLSLIDVNPMLRVDLPKVEKHDARSLTRKEIDSLLTVCLNDWTHPLIQVAIATGCRRGELLALEWPEVNFETGTIIVSKSLEQTHGGLRVKRPKNGKTRTFQLPQSAVTALKFQRESQVQHRKMFGADYKDLQLVFCQPDGSYLDPALVSQTLVRRMKKAGISDASLHTLRHTHASGLLSNGVPLPVVSARLGHANTHVTATIYAHALPADDQRAADQWDEFLKGKVQ
jgi:integrase